ncbi:unnamed protein product [Prorocentrum cordatum]|uniref:Uncharacterized protein n=1 Tax=Prorocentrum cordatum TaxID=2364126 RepID=A0ABN9VPG2_9DINO|nr:unnamed protein product [Polarella glacialis]
MEDARRREEDRLKAQQALFDDLDRRPQKQPAPQAEPAPGATAASSGPAAEAMSARPPAVAPPAQPAAPRQQPQQPPPQQRQGAAAGAPAGVYVPPSWNTRPPALELPRGQRASVRLRPWRRRPRPAAVRHGRAGGPERGVLHGRWFQDWFAQESTSLACPRSCRQSWCSAQGRAAS